MKRITSLIALALLLLSPSLVQAQATMPSTTLTNAITATTTTLVIGSTTNSSYTMVAGDFIQIGRENMRISQVVNTTQIVVQRGFNGTRAAAWPASSTIYFGPGRYFMFGDAPRGTCTATTDMLATPQVVVSTGEVYSCPSSGVRANLWTLTSAGGQRFAALSDKYVFVSATACNSSVSGNGTGTNGFTTSGTSGTPVVQAETSNTGTNTHTYSCNIPLPSRSTSGYSVAISDVTFLYGVQTSNLGTQAATLASGTMNSTLVFSSITYPTPAASETASTVAPVRADSGTLTITPVVASANVATTTAGAFYSVRFTPASPITVSSDLAQLILRVTLQAAATSATVTNTPGFIVRYTEIAN